MKIEATVQRGTNKGVKLLPHVHEDGMLVLSPTRFERDYVRVGTLSEVVDAMKRGLRVRMSNPGAGIRTASLISPDSIEVSL